MILPTMNLRPIQLRRIICSGVFLAAAVPAPMRAQAAQAADTLSRIDRWRADLRFFATELPARHLNAFAFTTREAFTRAVAELDSAIPRLSDTQVQLRVSRLAAMLRDGHTRAPLPATQYLRRLPITALWTDEGLHVTGTTEPWAELLGQRIVSINGHPIEQVADTLRLYYSHENEQGFRTQAGFILYRPSALRDVGLGTDVTHAVIEFEKPGAARTTVELPTVPVAGFKVVPPATPLPLYRQRTNEKFWFTVDTASKTLYLAYNECSGAEDFRKLVDSMTHVIDNQHPARVVVDLRNNPGGDSRVIAPLFAAIRARPAINRPDALFAVIGRVTFSSGLMAAVDFRRLTKATILGEPLGERPNSYGEVRSFKLPNSGLDISYSTKFFRLVDGNPDSFFPDVNTPPTAAAVIAGRDPAMEWILARGQPKSTKEQP